MRIRPAGLRKPVIVVFGAIGIGLIPWTVWLSSTLKPEHTTHRWDLAWSGFDTGLALAFLGTAVAAWRRSPWVGAFAAATGTLLITDAWFDIVLESRVDEMRTAIVEAAIGELPGAALCFWLAYRTEHFLGRVVHAVGGVDAALHLASAGQRTSEGDLVGIFQVAADRETAGQARDPDPSA
jgi:hypothetical protein